jgi:hypothetical protein
MRMRIALVGMGGQRLLAIVTAIAVMVSMLVVLAKPAQAHTDEVEAGCYGWGVELWLYNTASDNSVKIWIDGAPIVDIADFGASHSEAGTWDPTKNHTIKVEVEAWDDPTGSKGWSFTQEKSSQACQQPTTTSTLAPTTSTTLPPTTTSTTMPPTTTTVTLPDRFVCVEGEVITVGPNDEGYESAYETKDAAAADPACRPTTTTMPTTTTLPDRYICDDAGLIVVVKPGDGGYDQAFDMVEEARETCAEVEGTVVTTTPEVEAEELPFTGVDINLVGLSIVLLGAGVALLTLTRRLEEN